MEKRENERQEVSAGMKMSLIWNYLIPTEKYMKYSRNTIKEGNHQELCFGLTSINNQVGYV